MDRDDEVCRSLAAQLPAVPLEPLRKEQIRARLHEEMAHGVPPCL